MLGLDIGGANLKIADGRGDARSVAFALWREPRELCARLCKLLNEYPRDEDLAVTMTGELCDCFSTKADGVRHILAAIENAAGDRAVIVYLTDGRFVPIAEALRTPLAAAASNWHALATFACRYVESGIGVLIDIGSTTTDIVPLTPNGPIANNLDDTSRLIAGEMVYSGVGRTPIYAVCASLTFHVKQCPVAAEFFATTADAYVTLNEIAENPADTNTADSRPKTKAFAQTRLARSICMDPAKFYLLDARAAAIAVREAQTEQLLTAVRKILARLPDLPETIVISGSGEFLARRLVRKIAPHARVTSLAERLGAAVSRCAPAHAVAVLAQ